MYCTLCGTRFCWTCLGALPSPQSARPQVFPHAHHPRAYNNGYANLYPPGHSRGLPPHVRVNMNISVNPHMPLTPRCHYFEGVLPSNSAARMSSLSTMRDAHHSENPPITRARAVRDVALDQDPQKSLRPCICPRMRSAACAVAMSAAAVAAAPVAAAAAVIAAPPMVAVYAVLPRERKRVLRDQIGSFMSRF